MLCIADTKVRPLIVKLFYLSTGTHFVTLSVVYVPSHVFLPIQEPLTANGLRDLVRRIVHAEYEKLVL